MLDVLNAIRANYVIGHAWMAEEFHGANHARTRREFAAAFAGVPLTFEPHIEFKKRVPHAIGLIRTGDTIQFANSPPEQKRTLRQFPRYPFERAPCTLVTP